MQYKKSLKIGRNTCLRRDPNQLFSEIDNEIILLSINNGEYYYLNRVGSEIWHILEKETSYQLLIKKLTQKFDISEEECMQDTKPFLLESVIKGIIQFVDE